MQFTPQQLKLIERLRKQEQTWPRMRWVLLAAAVLGLGACVYFAYFLYRLLDSQALSRADCALLFAVFWPWILLMVIAAVASIALAIRDWHGNAHRALLLRLLEAREKEARESETGVSK